MNKEEINLRDYIDPLGRWPSLRWDTNGVLWIQYEITVGDGYSHKNVLKYVRVPEELIEKLKKETN